MSGQEVSAWLDFKYEGSVDSIEYDYGENFRINLRREKRYDYAWEREWNNLYGYDD